MKPSSCFFQPKIIRLNFNNLRFSLKFSKEEFAVNQLNIRIFATDVLIVKLIATALFAKIALKMEIILGINIKLSKTLQAVVIVEMLKLGIKKDFAKTIQDFQR